MKRSVITNQAQNVENYGLEVNLDFLWLGATLSSDNAGIINGSIREEVEVVL